MIDDVLLRVVVLSIEDSLFKAEVLVIVFTQGACGPLAHPLGTVSPVVRAEREQVQHVWFCINYNYN